MVGGKRKLSADERLRLADWPWPVERRRRGSIRTGRCAPPSWSAPCWLARVAARAAGLSGRSRGATGCSLLDIRNSWPFGLGSTW